MKAVIDIETGGFSKKKNGLCSIAVVVFDEEYNEFLSMHYFVKPYINDDGTDEVEYCDSAMEINGLIVEQLRSEGIGIAEVCRHVYKTLDGLDVDLLIGHNIDSFDYPWVKYLIERFTICDFNKQTDDTLKMCRERLRLSSNKLSDVCRELGIRIEKEHDALEDARATLQLYKILNLYY